MATARANWTETGANQVYAALDMGTHNCRLLIARPDGQGFRVIDSFSRIVKLGEGVRLYGEINENAQQRALKALHICAEKLAYCDVTRLRAVATQACRLARNGSRFLERVARETGIVIDLITAEEEAQLAIAGCLSLMEERFPYGIIFDIGGGSTQVILLSRITQEIEITGSISIPYGVVTLGEEIGTDKLPVDIYEGWIQKIVDALSGFSKTFILDEKIASGKVQMLGASGTVTTLAGIHLALPRYLRAAVDGAYLNFEAARIISSNLRQKNLRERAAHPCIGEERADLVLAGCIILEAICRLWPVGQLRVADRGIREGILYRMIGEDNQYRR